MANWEVTLILIRLILGQETSLHDCPLWGVKWVPSVLVQWTPHFGGKGPRDCDHFETPDLRLNTWRRKPEEEKGSEWQRRKNISKMWNQRMHPLWGWMLKWQTWDPLPIKHACPICTWPGIAGLGDSFHGRAHANIVWKIKPCYFFVIASHGYLHILDKEW